MRAARAYFLKTLFTLNNLTYHPSNLSEFPPIHENLQVETLVKKKVKSDLSAEFLNLTFSFGISLLFI